MALFFAFPIMRTPAAYPLIIRIEAELIRLTENSGEKVIRKIKESTIMRRVPA